MSPYERFLAAYRQIAAIDSALSVLSWDQQVLMPPGGSPARAEHLALLATMRHAKFTSDEFKRIVEQAEVDVSDEVQASNIRVIQRDLRIESSKPGDLVARKLRVGSAAYDAWRIAKPANDFATMRPYYAELFEIARETSAALGQAEHPYDNLIDQFEEGSTCAEAKRVFDELKAGTVPLLREIRQRGQTVDDGLIARDFDRPRLLEFARSATAAVGFDHKRGRLDLANNAFCSGTSRDDVRMTTRPSNHLKGIVSSSLHEMGHGLYNQGMPPDWFMTPIAAGASMAVHESQSRMWENMVGRSLGFWKHFLPKLSMVFPELVGIGGADMWRMVNRVQPEFVRVGADELTYNLHILVRFELEVAIVEGSLDVGDLPQAWNEKYETYLGINPPTNTLGVLQDVHWTRGSVGYFPTYTFGNLLSGQLWAHLVKDFPSLDEDFERGQFEHILQWLTEKIYSKGRSIPPKALMQSVTGKSLGAGDWLDYAQRKFSEIYRL